MVLEVDDDVHHNEHLGREHVVGAACASLQPLLKRLQRPTGHKPTATFPATATNTLTFQASHKLTVTLPATVTDSRLPSQPQSQS